MFPFRRFWKAVLDCRQDHVKYQGEEAVVGMPDAENIEGRIQKNRMKLVQAWIEIHRDEMIADWELTVNGQEVFKIESLK